MTVIVPSGATGFISMSSSVVLHFTAFLLTLSEMFQYDCKLWEEKRQKLEGDLEIA